MKTHPLFCLFIGILANHAVASANDEVLNQSVTLQSEAVLIDTLSVTLQHAIMTSSAYQGSNPNLKRLAKLEINKRQQDLQRLHQLSKTKVPAAKSALKLPHDDVSYQKSILQNHARLIEIAEFGAGLKLTNPTRRYLKALSGDVAPELVMLDTLLDS